MKVSNFIPQNVGFFVKIYKQRITQKKKLEPAHPKKNSAPAPQQGLKVRT